VSGDREVPVFAVVDPWTSLMLVLEAPQLLRGLEVKGRALMAVHPSEGHRLLQSVAQIRRSAAWQRRITGRGAVVEPGSAAGEASRGWSTVEAAEFMEVDVSFVRRLARDELIVSRMVKGRRVLDELSVRAYQAGRSRRRAS
jgi:hypothetical protein